MSDTIAIIGAGNLGSRHLQGILHSRSTLLIYVLDPQKSSLLLSERRAAEVEHNHEIRYIDSIDKLPIHLSLVIVATNADVREQVTSTLLRSRKIKNLLLEKVLFQKLEDYDRVAELINLHQVNTWVNHPRRCQAFYQQIKSELKSCNIISIEAFGQNWGLASNALHILDLIVYLSDSPLEILDLSALDNHVLESKRPGFIELSGRLSGKTVSGLQFNITSVFNADELVKPLMISVHTPSKRFVIQEGATTQVVSLKEKNDFFPVIRQYDMKHQSELSGIIANNILTKRTSALPTYKEASTTHKTFIQSLLAHYNLSSLQSTNICPIT